MNLQENNPKKESVDKSEPRDRTIYGLNYLTKRSHRHFAG